jgi:hypothetical protein
MLLYLIGSQIFARWQPDKLAVLTVNPAGFNLGEPSSTGLRTMQNGRPLLGRSLPCSGSGLLRRSYKVLSVVTPVKVTLVPLDRLILSPPYTEASKPT